MGFDLHLGVRAKALITGIICGIAGVMVDLDHLPRYLFNMRVEPIFMIQGIFDKGGAYAWGGRPIHPLVLYIALVAFTMFVGLLFQYSVRSTARSMAKTIVKAVQKAISPVQATE